jgi:hypothetical protein
MRRQQNIYVPRYQPALSEFSKAILALSKFPNKINKIIYSNFNNVYINEQILIRLNI